MKKTLNLFSLIILVGITSTTFCQTTPDYLANPLYQREIEFYKIYKPENVKIVMLGNSLTHGVEWNQLLGRNDVIDMGIVSDILAGFKNRLSYVYKVNPRVCFILGGINDIYQWIPVEQIYSDYIEVIQNLQKRGIKPVIQSTMYAGQEWGKDWLAQNKPELKPVDVNAERNQQVERLNTMLKDYADKNNIEFIDLNKLMTRNHFLRSELTIDGIHLNAAGYKIWGREVEETLKKLGI